MTGPCIGYLPDGRVCRRPAEVLDEQAGGMLCRDCAEAKRRRLAKGRDLSPPVIEPGSEADAYLVNWCADLTVFLHQRGQSDSLRQAP